MTIKQLSIFVENRPGRMAEITDTLAAKSIDIRALSLADTSDFGMLRLIVTDPEGAVTALSQAGMTVRLTDVIAFGVSEKPGQFAESVRLLSDAGVNIEYLYAFLARKDEGAVIIMRVDQTEKAAEALREKGLRLMSGKEIYNM